jgi:hypothetical protein
VDDESTYESIVVGEARSFSIQQGL